MIRIILIIIILTGLISWLSYRKEKADTRHEISCMQGCELIAKKYMAYNVKGECWCYGASEAERVW
jgi:hypothetical protein